MLYYLSTILHWLSTMSTSAFMKVMIRMCQQVGMQNTPIKQICLLCQEPQTPTVSYQYQ